MNLLTLEFWFKLNPAPLLDIYHNILVGFIVFLIVLSFFVRIFKLKKGSFYKRFWNQMFTFLMTNAFLGLIIWFFNYERVPFFASRFWFLIWGVGMLIWLVCMFKPIRHIPRRKEEIAKEAEYKKYIP